MASAVCSLSTMSRSVELRRARPLLGTLVEISARGCDEKRLRAGLTNAFVAVAKVQTAMSFHEPESDVSRLNRQAFREPVRVHDWTVEVLKSAHTFSVLSAGAFDITVAPLLSAWGYLPPAPISDSAATFRDIVLGPENTVRFARPLAIDLGGIAKGFAVDRAVEALQAAGVRTGSVNAGGDLRVFGTDAQEIHLRDPHLPGTSAAVVSLRNRAIATSGVYFSAKTHRGIAVSPLVDGKTRRPLVKNISVAVSAADCLTADALTKIALACGPHCGHILRACAAEAVLLERGKAPSLLSTDAPKFRQA